MKYLGFLLLTFCLAIFSEESSTNKKIDNIISSIQFLDIKLDNIDLRLSGLEDEHRNFKKEVDEILTVISSSLDDLEEDFGELEEDFGEIDDFVNSNEMVKEINEDVLNSISSNIQFLDTEVRKLWDLSNKRNKVKINNLEKTIKDLTILIQQLEVKISKLEDSSG